MAEKSRLLRKSIYQVDENIKELFPSNPSSDDVAEEMEYTRKVIEVVENNDVLISYPKVKEKLNYLKEIVEDYEDELVLSNDSDAKTGHKSKDNKST